MYNPWYIAAFFLLIGSIGVGFLFMSGSNQNPVNTGPEITEIAEIDVESFNKECEETETVQDSEVVTEEECEMVVDFRTDNESVYNMGEFSFYITEEKSGEFLEVPHYKGTVSVDLDDDCNQDLSFDEFDKLRLYEKGSITCLEQSF